MSAAAAVAGGRAGSRARARRSLETLQAKEGLLEFWLRMGFEDMSEEPGATPITGVMDLPLPATLLAAAGGVSDPGSISSSQARGEGGRKGGGAH